MSQGPLHRDEFQEIRQHVVYRFMSTTCPSSAVMFPSNFRLALHYSIIQERKLCFNDSFLIPDGKKQEVNLGGGTPRHCFFELMPGTEYRISVHTQLQEIEGPAVSIMETTCE